MTVSTPIGIRSIEISTESIAVHWTDGPVSTFHGMWLRDNCSCRACGPHAAGSRLQSLLDIPDDVSVESASADSTVLRIVWSGDGHESAYEADWLRGHAYGPAELCAERRAPKTLWKADLGEWPSVEWDEVLADDAVRCRLHASVSELGFVLVRGLGTDHDAIERLAAEVGYLRETHYGRFFDLVTRSDKPMILADLAGPLRPHTDEAYRRVPTGINMFHCIKAGEAGSGVSQLVDAHAVAEALRVDHPEVFELLTRMPVRHERCTEDQTIVSDLPSILLDHEDEVVEVRLNERTMTAVCVEEKLMPTAYAALRTAFRVAYDPAFRIGYQLQPGEALLFDNLRVLHARTGYSGDRHLRQCQVMRDEFFARGVFLAEKLDMRTSVLS
jgi:alpha-ketoglutarate-dependent taurine dioxygenase